MGPRDRGPPAASRVWVKTSLAASKASDAAMHATPVSDRLTSPAEARAVPPAMAATAPTRSRQGFSSPAAKSAAVFFFPSQNGRKR